VDRTRAAVLVTGLIAAVLGPVGQAAAATGTADVEDYRFTPTQVRINPGDRVRWTNRGDQVHTVSSDDPGAEDFDSGRLGPGDEYTHTFSKPGRFAYHCEVHSSMSGVIQVDEPPTTTTSSSTTTTSPPTTTTTQPPTTTTTRPAPAPPTTTTTAPAPAPTTVTTSRGPTGAASPAPATTAPTTATTNPAVTTTTTAPATTTTTVAAETTTTTAAAGEPATPLGPEVPPRAPSAEEDGEEDLAGDNVASPRSRGSDGGPDAGGLLLMLAVLGAGAFGAWTLWKLRPGNTS
jgi:plastocyanin